MRLFKFHLGMEVSIYAFCGTLAAKVNLLNSLFGRTKLILAKVQAQASRPIELGAALDSNFVFPSSKSLRSQQ